MTWYRLPELLRAHLLEDLTIAEAVGERVHYQTIPDDTDPPWVWFSMNGRQNGEELGGGDGIREVRYSFEVVATDPPVWLDYLVAALEAFEVEEAGLVVQLVEVEDADDDYVFRSVGEGDAEFLHALTVVCYVTDE